MISLPLWVWILFYVLVFIMLLIDLKSFGKQGQHEVSVSEALKMTAVWIGVSLLFCAGIEFFYPGDSHEKAMEFLAGYLIEKSLSMDNLFWNFLQVISSRSHSRWITCLYSSCFSHSSVSSANTSTRYFSGASSVHWCCEVSLSLLVRR